MQKSLIKLLVKLMREKANEIESGSCVLSEEEQIDLLSLITHKSLSNEEACEFMHMSRSTFSNLIRAGKIPKGRKLRGRKELVWFEDELRNVDLSN